MATTKKALQARRTRQARKAGLVGGPARAIALSQVRRKEIAKQAVTARWQRYREQAAAAAQAQASAA